MLRDIIGVMLVGACSMAYATSSLWVSSGDNSNIAASFNIAGSGSMSSPVTRVYFYRDTNNTNCSGGDGNYANTSFGKSYTFYAGTTVNVSAASIYTILFNAVGSTEVARVGSIKVVPYTGYDLSTPVFIEDGFNLCFPVICSTVSSECVYSDGAHSAALNNESKLAEKA